MTDTNVKRAKLNKWLYESPEGAMFSSLILKYKPLLHVGFHHMRHGKLPKRTYVAGTSNYLFYVREPNDRQSQQG